MLINKFREHGAIHSLNSKISTTLRHFGSSKHTGTPGNVTKSVAKGLKVKRLKSLPANDSYNLTWAISNSKVHDRYLEIWRNNYLRVYWEDMFDWKGTDSGWLSLAFSLHLGIKLRVFVSFYTFFSCPSKTTEANRFAWQFHHIFFIDWKW